MTLRNKDGFRACLPEKERESKSKSERERERRETLLSK
jgi:hypothetical protein